jgi:hypothetical protein
MKLLPIVVVSCCVLSGCAGNLSIAGDQATLSGSPEGLRAMFDGFGGLISGGKASPDKLTGYQRARMAQEKEITKRQSTPSFLASLMSRNSASTVTNIDASTPNEIE